MHTVEREQISEPPHVIVSDAKNSPLIHSTEADPERKHTVTNATGFEENDTCIIGLHSNPAKFSIQYQHH